MSAEAGHSPPSGLAAPRTVAVVDAAEAFWLSLAPCLLLATDATRGLALAGSLLLLGALLLPLRAALRPLPARLRLSLTALGAATAAGCVALLATLAAYGAREALQFGVPLLALALAFPPDGSAVRAADPSPLRLLAAATLLILCGGARGALASWPLFERPFAVLLLLALLLGARAARRPGPTRLRR